MGLRYRKSFGSGPVRINVSKSGVGWSVGTKGARITKKTNGGYRTTASIPGAGISYVKDSDRKKEPARTAVALSSGFWKVFFACVCFAIAIACGLSPDGVTELTAFMSALGVLLIVLAFVPARARKKEKTRDSKM